ncbi:MAG: addiction module toxin RelE [Corynebacterium glutamicum]|nr:addiction module toxin RelE [Corynebacterium glutamicum]
MFAFDPHRQSNFLVAGDKIDQWNKWYSKNIPIADERFDYHLKQLKKGN